MNAACTQYATDCASSLPHTGFDAAPIVILAFALLAAGIALAISLRRRP
jgi:LPXTG-motif cell wall-anchored protein